MKNIVKILSLPVHFTSVVLHSVLHIHIPKHISKHIHASHIKFGAGAAVTYIGVSVAKLGHNFHGTVLEIIVDAVGYTLHAIGIIPIVDVCSEKIKKIDVKVAEKAEKVVVVVDKVVKVDAGDYNIT